MKAMAWWPGITMYRYVNALSHIQIVNLDSKLPGISLGLFRVITLSLFYFFVATHSSDSDVCERVW